MAGETGNEHGEKLDRILGHLDSLHAKHDALMAKHDALHVKHDALEGKYEELSKRFDSMEERLKDGDTSTEREKEEREERERADKARKDAEEKVRKDAAEKEEKEKTDKARKDAEEKEERERADKARKDAEEEEAKKRADKARKDADDDRIASLSSRVDSALTDIQKRLPVILPEAERSKFVDVQSRISEIAQAFGDSGGAPRWLDGESLADYQRRLLSKYKMHSADWKDKDLANVHESVLDIAEKRIRADSLEAAKSPEVGRGQLRAVQSKDNYGRTITKFFGDPLVAYAPFMFNGLIRQGRITPPSALSRH